MAKHSPSEIKHHIEVIDAELAAKRDMLPKLSITDPVDNKIRMEYTARISELQRGIAYWNNEHRKLTGQSANVPRAKTFTQMDAEAKHKQQQQYRAEQQARRQRNQQVKDLIFTAESDLKLLKDRIMSTYNDAHNRGLNFIFSHWARMGAGLWWRTPFIIRDQTVPKVEAALSAARQALARGNHQSALKHIQTAAAWLQYGFQRINQYLARIQVGGQRAITGIKITAALATTALSGGTNLGIVGTMGVAMTGEAATQGTDLALRALDDGHNVSAQDVNNAAAEVLIAGVSAGGGKLLTQGAGAIARAVSKGVGPRIANKIALEILGKKAPPGFEKYLVGAIEGYVAANASTILKKWSGLDKEPGWDWWATQVAPFAGSVAREFLKEKDVREPVLKAVSG